MRNIFNFGSLNLDKVYSVKEFVTRGETIAALDMKTYPGGKGLNQSIAAARAGGCIWHIGCIGQDGYSLKEYLMHDGVHCDFIKTVEGPSGHAVIQVDQEGQNGIIVYPGANHRLEKEHIDEVFLHICKDDLVLIQNETNHIAYIMEKSREKGTMAVFNPSPITEDLYTYPLGNVDLFVLNEVEGAVLSGCRDIADIPDGLMEKYPEADMLLTLGEKGSLYMRQGIKTTQKAFKIRAVDTTGAGDTFCGYFLACLAQGMAYDKAMCHASAAAAIAVSRKGAASSIPFITEVETFVKEHNG